MEKSITVKIGMTELEKLLINYYKEFFKEPKLELECSIETRNEFYHNIEIIICRQNKIGKFDADFKYKLTDEEISEVINESISQNNYEIDGLLYYKVENSKLLGVECNVRKKQKQKKKGCK